MGFPFCSFDVSSSFLVNFSILSSLGTHYSQLKSSIWVTCASVFIAFFFLILYFVYLGKFVVVVELWKLYIKITEVLEKRRYLSLERISLASGRQLE